SDTATNSITTLQNTGNNTITIDNILIQPEASWISLGSFNLQPLNPGDTATIPVIIDPTQAVPGNYKGSLMVFAHDSSGNYINTTVGYSITIVSANGYSGSVNTTIQIPAFSPLNTPFNIELANLQPSETVNVIFQPMDGVSCNPSATSYSNGFWSTQCSATIEGVYNVQVVVNYNNKNSNVPVQSWNQDLLVGLTSNDLNFKFTPPLAPMQTSTIQLIDNTTGNVVFSNAQFSINGNNTGNTINPIPGQQYTICAELSGQENKCTTINTPLINMQINANPSNPSEGQAVTLTAIGQNNLPIQPVFYLNGAPLQGNTFTASIGTQVITAKENGYNDGSLIITPTPIITNLQTNYAYGSNVILQIMPATNWTVLYSSNNYTAPTLYANGYSTQINMTNLQTGQYTIQTNGVNIGSFTVSSASIMDLIPSWVWDVLIAIIVAIILVIIYYFIKGREDKRKANSLGGGGWTSPGEIQKRINLSDKGGHT
ncbi:MAG: hypothetical protein QXI16_04295, partial [Sulfolobaceae archaeon]